MPEYQTEKSDHHPPGYAEPDPGGNDSIPYDHQMRAGDIKDEEDRIDRKIAVEMYELRMMELPPGTCHSSDINNFPDFRF